jgi:hypothetical protein
MKPLDKPPETSIIEPVDEEKTDDQEIAELATLIANLGTDEEDTE